MGKSQIRVELLQVSVTMEGLEVLSPVRVRRPQAVDLAEWATSSAAKVDFPAVISLTASNRLASNLAQRTR